MRDTEIQKLILSGTMPLLVVGYKPESEDWCQGYVQERYSSGCVFQPCLGPKDAAMEIAREECESLGHDEADYVFTIVGTDPVMVEQAFAYLPRAREIVAEYRAQEALERQRVLDEAEGRRAAAKALEDAIMQRAAYAVELKELEAKRDHYTELGYGAAVAVLLAKYPLAAANAYERLGAYLGQFSDTADLAKPNL